MRLTVTKTREQIAAERRARYLESWPPHAQLEALQDAFGGRPDKIERMTADFSAIRAALPYQEE